jgi:hypothetical protein
VNGKKSGRPAGSKNHSVAPAAPISSAVNASCAHDSLMSGRRMTRWSASNVERRFAANSATASSAIAHAASARKVHGGSPTIAATAGAANRAAAIATQGAPTVNATAR